MRYISPTLLQKLKDKFQTIYNDADPRMEIFISRTNRYIQQGTLLNPKTVREGEELGPLDLAVRREDPNELATELVMIYIEGGDAKIATLDAVPEAGDADKWKYRKTLGPAVDVAVEFDGHWERITDREGIWWETATRFVKVSEGEPWFFRVTPGGDLLARQGMDGSDSILATNVSKCAALRGWKSVTITSLDQGLVVAYIVSGEVRYRNLAEQEGGSVIWESEKTVTDIPTPAEHVALFRTNDYRLGILAEVNGEMHWAITERNWAGMGIPPEAIAATIDEYSIELIEITYRSGYAPDEVISASITGYEVLFCPNIYPQLTDLYNPSEDDTTTIVLEFDMDMENHTGQEAAFTVIDENLNTYAVLSTAQGATVNIVELTTKDFSGAAGDLTVEYDDSVGTLCSTVEGGCKMKLASFTQSFTPLIAPLEGYTSETISASIEGFALDLITVTYKDGYAPDEKISASITGYSLVLIHVDDLEP